MFVLMSTALNVSKEMGFQDGILEAILLKIFSGEVTGDILGAFQLAVLLKTLDLKVNKLCNSFNFWPRKQTILAKVNEREVFPQACTPFFQFKLCTCALSST